MSGHQSSKAEKLMADFLAHTSSCPIDEVSKHYYTLTIGLLEEHKRLSEETEFLTQKKMEQESKIHELTGERDEAERKAEESLRKQRYQTIALSNMQEIPTSRRRELGLDTIIEGKEDESKVPDYFGAQRDRIVALEEANASLVKDNAELRSSPSRGKARTGDTDSNECVQHMTTINKLNKKVTQLELQLEDKKPTETSTKGKEVESPKQTILPISLALPTSSSTTSNAKLLANSVSITSSHVLGLCAILREVSGEDDVCNYLTEMCLWYFRLSHFLNCKSEGCHETPENESTRLGFIWPPEWMEAKDDVQWKRLCHTLPGPPNVPQTPTVEAMRLAREAVKKEFPSEEVMSHTKLQELEEKLLEGPKMWGKPETK